MFLVAHVFGVLQIQELPDRLIRSGRIDVRCEFGLATKSQIRGLFRLYFGPDAPKQEEQFVSSCPEGKYSCSEVGFFFFFFY